MNPIASQKRLILLVAAGLAVAGALCWLLMPRQEDPDFPYRNGLLIIPFPGADPYSVERLVIEPVEDALAEVNDIKHINATARSGVAIVSIALRDVLDSEAADDAWDDVRVQLTEAQRDFPDAVSEPELSTRLTDLESIVVAVTGSDDPLELADAAETLRDAMRRLPQVSRVEMTADPGEQITITLDDAVSRRLGIDAQTLAGALAARNQIIPGGGLKVGATTVSLDPRSDFKDLESLARTPIVLPSGSAIELRDVARVERGVTSPAQELMRFNGQPAVAIGVVPRDRIDVVSFGRDVHERLDAVAADIAPLKLNIIAAQPDRVEARLSDLGSSLLQGVGIVALVLIFAMGLRLGLLVSLIVPLVALSSLAVYAGLGGTLHQISIAALVLSLGLLVDNAIVIAERIQWRLDRDETLADAAWNTVKELFWPLGAATGTTLASFLPLLLSTGPSADFTRAIPQVVMLTLVLSFIFAVTVTPALALFFMKRSKAGAAQAPAWLRRFSATPGRHPWLVLAAAVLLVVSTGALAPLVKLQFFPGGDRNQVVLEMEWPEGTHLSQTDQSVRMMEEALMRRPEVVNVSSYVGRSTPAFYYNLLRKPRAPQLGQLLVTLQDQSQVPELMDWSRRQARQLLPGVTFVARSLEQGPPLKAPIEIRVYGDGTNDLKPLARWTQEVHGVLASLDTTRDVRNDLSLGAPTLTLNVDDAAAARARVSRRDVALAVLGRARGIPVGDFRAGDEVVPILVRAPEGEHYPIEQIDTVDVAAPGIPAVPLAAVAQTAVEMRPASIKRRDRRRFTTVLAQLAPGQTFGPVMALIKPRLVEMEAQGLVYELGGEAEGSGEANTAIFTAAPLGAMALLFFLLAQFRSFRKVGIILLTVPLAVTGVIPGLLLFDQPFGFTSLLGVLSLIGIVVNNAIILIDVIDVSLEEGAPLQDALEEAVQVRLRPILLTTLTTVLGLAPLLFSSSTLWPPLASAMITGLLASTGLTLLVVPAVYRLLFARSAAPKAAAATAALLLLALAAPAAAQPVTLDQAMSMAEARQQVEASKRQVQAAESQHDLAVRQAWAPSLTVQAEATARSEALGAETPFGVIENTPDKDAQAAVVLRQPILQPADQWLRVDAAEKARQTADHQLTRTLDASRFEAANAYLRVLAIDAGRTAVAALIQTLDSQLSNLRALEDAGRTLESDRLRVEAALASARQDQLALTQNFEAARWDLSRTINLQGAAQLAPWSFNAFESLNALLAIEPEDVIEKRADLLALNAQIERLGLEGDAILWDAAPQVTVEGRWITISNEVARPGDWFEAGVTVTWTPFAGGSRLAAQDNIEHQRAALQAQRIERKRAIEVQVIAARARLNTSLAAIPVRGQAREQLQESLRITQERYKAGRAILTDVLTIAAEVRQSQAQEELARIEAIGAAFELLFAAGLPVELPQP